MVLLFKSLLNLYFVGFADVLRQVDWLWAFLNVRSDGIGKVLTRLLAVAFSIVSSICCILALLLLAVAVLALVLRECHRLHAHALLVQRVVQDADRRQVLIDPGDS